MKEMDFDIYDLLVDKLKSNPEGLVLEVSRPDPRFLDVQVHDTHNSLLDEWYLWEDGAIET